MTDERNGLPDEKNAVPNTSTSSPAGNGRMGKIITLGIAFVYVLVSGYLLLDMRGKISAMEQKQAYVQQNTGERITALESNLTATSDALASRVGMTQEELAKKTTAPQQTQHAAVSQLSVAKQTATSECTHDAHS